MSNVFFPEYLIYPVGIGLIAIGIYLYSWISLFVHEAGHVAGGRLAGLDVMEVHLGRGLKTWRFTRGNLHWHLRVFPTAGHVVLFPRTPHGFRMRWAIGIFAGPFATAALAALLAWILTQIPWGARSGMIWALKSVLMGAFFTELSRLFFVLWPRTYPRSEGIESDGLALWRVLFSGKDHRHRGEQFWHQGKAYRATRAENLPEAIRHMREAVRLEGSPAAAAGLKACLADLCALNGDFSEAEHLHREMIRALEPTDPRMAQTVDGFATFALAHNQAHLFNLCEGLVRDLVAKYPLHHTLKGTLGSLLIEQGCVGEGRPLIEDLYASKTNGTDTGICAAYLSLLESRRGETERAARLADEARQLLGEHALVKRLLKAASPPATAPASA